MPEYKSHLAVTSATAAHGFGFLSFLATPLYLLLRLLHDHLIANWGWSIVALTAVFNLILIWPRILSMRSSVKRMRLQPSISALRQRFEMQRPDDPARVQAHRQQRNTELLALYRAEGASTFGGCLPLLLQMPLLFACVSVLRHAAELHHAHWLWLSDLASPDPLHILPLLIVAGMIVTQIITPAANIQGMPRWLQILLMPAVMGISLWHYAAGLSLYWITGNLVNILLQLAINRTSLGREMQTLATARQKES